MRYLLPVLLISLTAQLSVAPPVTQKKQDGEQHENEVEDSEDMAEDVEYRRYLAEVVQALESDPEFRAKLEKANQADIRTGKIADQLEFVNHKVRTKLDELKREELERLKHLVIKENNLLGGLDIEHLKIAEHVDHTNTRTFEIEDLKKLIAKTTKDLAEADRKRREEFKQYEMQKKFEEQEKLKSMNDEERKKYEDELHDIKEKHKKHEPVHHPGSKQQLEEVWEKQDHMESEDFNPKTFFFLHDVDGNGVWDQDEVKALFLKELDKLYAQGAPQDDLLKRTEEMERMREHVFNEADLNKDGIISYDEFLEQTKKPDFQQDEGWEGLDEQQIYTQEEFEAYERHRQEEIQKMIAKGMLPPHPGNVPAHHEAFPPQYVNVPAGQRVAPPQDYAGGRVPNQQFQDQHHQYPSQQGAIPQQQYPNHAQVPQIHDQLPQQQYHPELQQHQQYQGHASDQQYQHGQVQQQVPAQQYPQGQMPVQVVPQGQVPIQQQPSQGQVPVQQQHPQGHVPIEQHQQGQVPVQQHHPQGTNFQQSTNQQVVGNQVVGSVHNNALPQPNSQNQAQQQANPQAVQQEIHRNKLQSGGKA